MYVQGISSGVLAPGQQLTIWGGFFTDACQVLFNGVPGVVEDVEESSITSVCPDVLGEYTVEVKVGYMILSAGSLRVVQLGETPLYARPKDYSLGDLVSYVRGLFPRSAVLDLAPSSNFGKFIDGMARAVKYLWSVVSDLFRDLDPAHTESVGAWEADLGLPVDGILVNGFDERRAEIYRVACTKGGATKPYMLKILRLMGFEAEINEYYKDPEKFSNYNFPITADRLFYWRICLRVSDLNMVYADCETGTCDSYLAAWENYVVENTVNSIKPAHTVVIFAYDSN